MHSCLYLVRSVLSSLSTTTHSSSIELSGVNYTIVRALLNNYLYSSFTECFTWISHALLFQIGKVSTQNNANICFFRHLCASSPSWWIRTYTLIYRDSSLMENGSDKLLKYSNNLPCYGIIDQLVRDEVDRLKNYINIIIRSSQKWQLFHRRPTAIIVWLRHLRTLPSNQYVHILGCMKLV